MKILFIGLTENTSIRGVERYCIEILKIFNKNSYLKVTLILGQWQRYYNPLELNTINFLFVKCSNTKISRHFYLIKEIRQLSKNYDIVHYANTLPIIFKNNCPSVITIHDIAEFFVPEKYSYPQLLYRKLIVLISAGHADRIITVSNFSKYSISKFLKIKLEKITSIYNGIDHFIHIIDHSKSNKNPEFNNYFLYYGVLERSKGLDRSIHAFLRLKAFNPEVKFIIAGKKGNAFNDLKRFFDNKSIIYLDFVNDLDLLGLIKNALAIIFVSEYEGFGFPAIESFLLNDNIITSNTTSLGEIAKKFAIQVNPHNVDEIFYGMIKSMQKKNVDYTNEMEIIRQEVISEFSWVEACNKLIQVYNDLATIQL